MQGYTTTLTLTNANTDYSFAVPPNTLKLTFKSRAAVDLKYSFAGAGAIASSNYMTIPSGSSAFFDGRLIPQNIFFQSGTAGTIVEIETFRD